MMVYPAYTVDKIEEELSWRQINEIEESWNILTPQVYVLDNLRYIVGGFAGVNSEDMKISFNTEKKVKKFQFKTIEEAKNSLLLSGIPFVEYRKRKK